MSVPAWLTNPSPSSPTVVEPAAPPPLTDSAWAGRMRVLCLSIVHELRPRVVEPGDAADEACTKALAFLAALRDHPKHGRNWFARHGGELRVLVAPFFPAVFPPERTTIVEPDDEVEGDALAFAMEAIFAGGAYEGELDRYYRKKPRHLAGTAVTSTHVDGSHARPREPRQGELL